MALIQYLQQERQASSNLPFMLVDATASFPDIMQNAKDQILIDFRTRFSQDVVKKNNIPLTEQEIENIFTQWNSITKGDTFGKELTNKLTEYMDNKIFTGANIQADIEKAYLAMGWEEQQINSDKYVGDLQQILDVFQKRLNNYLEILYSIEEDFYLKKIIDLYRLTGKQPSEKFMSRYKNIKITPEQEANLDIRFNSNLNNLIDIMHSLNVINKKMSGVIVPADLFSDEKTGIQSSLNSISGETIHEPLTAWLINNKLGQDKEILSKLEDIFKTSNFKVTAETTGQNIGPEGTKMAGEQLKEDVGVTWDSDNFKIHFGVSNKLRQSQKNLSTKTGKLIGSVSPQSISLGELVSMSIQNGTPLAYEQGWSALLQSPSNKGKWNLKPWEDSWVKFKETAKYVALFRALIGTGLEGDFASIFIVNDKVFSGYDILKKVDDIQGRSKIVRWKESLPDYTDIKRDVDEPYQEKWPKKTEAENRQTKQKAIIDAWYKKKYHIEIQLKALMDSYQ